jgi:hypothetical protein
MTIQTLTEIHLKILAVRGRLLKVAPQALREEAVSHLHQNLIISQLQVHRVAHLVAKGITRPVIVQVVHHQEEGLIRGQVVEERGRL